MDFCRFFFTKTKKYVIILIKCYKINKEMNFAVAEYFFTNKHFHDLNPISAGYQKCEPLFFRGLKKLNYYVIHYVISGRGVLSIDDKIYKIHKNQVFIIPPNTRYLYQADETDPWEYSWINFDGSYADTLLNLKTPVVTIKHDYFQHIERCVEYTGQEADYLAGILFLIVTEIEKKPTLSNYVRMTKQYITNHYSQNITIEEIANTIGLDRKYLAKVFKESTNQTMSDFLLEVRMRQASGIISDGEKSVSAIAAKVGYDDPLFFSKQFKKYFGVSPTEFIENKKLEI